MCKGKTNTCLVFFPFFLHLSHTEDFFLKKLPRSLSYCIKVELERIIIMFKTFQKKKKKVQIPLFPISLCCNIPNYFHFDFIELAFETIFMTTFCCMNNLISNELSKCQTFNLSSRNTLNVHVYNRDFF